VSLENSREGNHNAPVHNKTWQDGTAADRRPGPGLISIREEWIFQAHKYLQLATNGKLVLDDTEVHRESITH
jgi:hypothetical protein